MVMKKTRFSTSRKRAIEDRAAINSAIDALVHRQPEDITDDDLENISDLSRPAAERLAERWLDIPHAVRLSSVQRMVSMFETSIEHHFEQALVVALGDVDDEIKLSAFTGLTDATASSFLRYLIERLPEERNPHVRSAGAEMMGQFVLQAELGNLDPLTAAELREKLISTMENDDAEIVRLHALESAGFFAGDQRVVRAIDDAWGSGGHEARVSSLKAMGRQGDPRWLERALSEFSSDEPEIRFEAVTAAGTLGGQLIVPKIIDLTDDEDVEVQMAAIASLGMIGGDAAVRALRGLEHSESIAIADAASAALDEALLIDNAARPPNSLWQS